jgi:hypothetical protein
MDPEGVTVSVMARISKRVCLVEQKRKDGRGKGEGNCRLTTIPTTMEEMKVGGMVKREREKKERRATEKEG